VRHAAGRAGALREHEPPTAPSPFFIFTRKPYLYEKTMRTALTTVAVIALMGLQYSFAQGIEGLSTEFLQSSDLDVWQ
jgi:hypothetical protein